MNDATTQLTQQLLQGLLMPERKEPKPKDDSLLNSILGAIIGRGLGGGIGAAAPPANTQGVLGPVGGPLAQSGVAAAGPILAGMGVPFVPGANVIGALATQKQFGIPSGMNMGEYLTHRANFMTAFGRPPTSAQEMMTWMQGQPRIPQEQWITGKK